MMNQLIVNTFVTVLREEAFEHTNTPSFNEVTFTFTQEQAENLHKALSLLKANRSFSINSFNLGLAYEPKIAPVINGKVIETDHEWSRQTYFCDVTLSKTCVSIECSHKESNGFVTLRASFDIEHLNEYFEKRHAA